MLKFNLNWRALFERMKSLTITHEFGIIENFNKQYVYNHYTPDIYDCIPVNDDFIQELIKPLAMMKTYFHTSERLANGLAYYGITLIPPESLPFFLDIVASKKSGELIDLARKITAAQEAEKYMIHYLSHSKSCIFVALFFTFTLKIRNI
ncbi:short-chain dehydrogenase [Niallia circulans]|uniref:short-chain dehydrogenase n=1 Tax=Niallia circulans TaxID=1397 RepID=UPI003982B9A4